MEPTTLVQTLVTRSPDLVHAFLDLVVAAHAANPRKWSISVYEKSVMLNFGGIFVGGLSTDSLRVAVDEDDIASADPEVAEKLRSGDLGKYKVLPTAHWIRLSAADVDRPVPQDHLYAKADLKWRGLNVRCQRAHQPQALDRLRRGLGRPGVPDPGWVADASAT